jgi:N-formylglutamate amidohydrolase
VPFPRSYIDPNRSLADVDPDLLADAWEKPGAVAQDSARHRPRLAHRAKRRADVRAQACVGQSAAHERCWKPYHEALAAEIDAHHRSFAVWHIDCH